MEDVVRLAADPAAWADDFGVEYPGLRQCPLFILLHHGRKAHNVGGQNGGEAAGGHAGRPARRSPALRRSSSSNRSRSEDQTTQSM